MRKVKILFSQFAEITIESRKFGDGERCARWLISTHRFLQQSCVRFFRSAILLRELVGSGDLKSQTLPISRWFSNDELRA
jgi:hypothetical protein